MPIFCNPFDEALVNLGPPAIFLLDREGMLRFDETWTRDAWGRASGPHVHAPGWALLRDRATGYVVIALATARSLLADHPRLDARWFDTLEAAVAARAVFGHPPIATEPWRGEAARC